MMTRWSGGRLKMGGSHTLNGAFVDLKRRDQDGTLWVTFCQSVGAYKEGEDYHVTEWEYEELWPGTV